MHKFLYEESNNFTLLLKLPNIFELYLHNSFKNAENLF